MKEDIERILTTLKEEYENIGLSYYPEDLLERKDPKIIYDYITQLETNWKELKKWLEEEKEKYNNWYYNDLTPHDRNYYKATYEETTSTIKYVLNKMQELEQ